MKRFKLTPYSAPEEDIQKALVKGLERWLQPDVVWFHVPNQWQGNVQRGKHLKELGQRAGVSDLVFFRKDFGMLCLEMKDDTGVQLPSQETFQALAEAAGARYEICRSSDSALLLLQDMGLLTHRLTF